MLDLTSILHFSHRYCVAICSALVPFNLATTLLTLILTRLNRRHSIWQPASLAIVGAGLMIVHVLSWFLVGVVRLETFVLLSLATCCLSINLWAIWHRSSLQVVIQSGVNLGQHTWRSLLRRVEVS